MARLCTVFVLLMSIVCVGATAKTSISTKISDNDVENSRTFARDFAVKRHDFTSSASSPDTSGGKSTKEELQADSDDRKRHGANAPPTPTTLPALPFDPDVIAQLIRLNMDKVQLFMPLFNALKSYFDPNILSNNAFLSVLNGGIKFMLADFPKIINSNLFHGTVDSLLTEMSRLNFTGIDLSNPGDIVRTVVSQLSYSNVLRTYYQLLKSSNSSAATPSLVFELEQVLLNFTLSTLPNLLRNPLVQDVAQVVTMEISRVNLTGIDRGNLPMVIQAVDSQIDWSMLLNRIYSDLEKSKLTPLPPTLQTAIGLSLLNFTLDTIPNLLKKPLTWQIGDILQAEVKQLNFSVVDPKNIPKTVMSILGQLHPGEVIARITALPGMQQANQEIPNVSAQCAEDVAFLFGGLFSGKSWALSMADALGKPGAGLLKGNLYEIGNYDQCFSSTAYGDTTVITGKHRTVKKTVRFRGQFCRVTINIPKSLVKSLNVDSQGIPVRLSWGICAPSTCAETDLKSVLTTGVLSRFNLDIEEVFCGSHPELKDDPSAAAAIGVLSFLIFFLLVGTTVDIIYHRKRDVQPYKATVNGFQEENNGFLHDEIRDKKPLQMEMETISSDNGDIGYIHETKNGTNSRKGYTRKEENMVVKLWSSFSVVSNAPRLLAASHAPGSISCVNGIRYFSMAWMILCNTFYFSVLTISDNQTAVNMLDATSYLKRFTFMPILYGTFAIDTFFLLSGFLVAYLFFKDLDKRNGTADCPKMVTFYVHRLCRITPMYMVVLMAFSCLYQYLGTGPMFPRAITDADNCKVNWWTNLLYVNNLVHEKEMCMTWSWYLSADMQFYIFSPVFILALYFFPVVGVILTSLLIAGSITSTAIIEHRGAGNILSTSQTPVPGKPSYFNDIFIKPWCRVSAYAIGLLLAKLIHYRGQKRFSKILATVGWLDAFGTGLFLVYIGYTEMKEGATDWSDNIRSAYESLSRPAFAASVAWVIFACNSGMGGIINSFLSFKGFIPLARMTYAAYLVHPILMVVYTYTRNSLIYIDDYAMVYFYIGHLCLSYAAAFILSIAFQWPFLNVEKIVQKAIRK